MIVFKNCTNDIISRIDCFFVSFNEISDNLYLDFNGIVHKCSHADEDSPLIARTEKEIMFAVFGYIERLFSIAKPKKVLFIAIDGKF